MDHARDESPVHGVNKDLRLSQFISEFISWLTERRESTGHKIKWLKQGT